MMLPAWGWWAAVVFSLLVLMELARLDLLFFRGLRSEPRLTDVPLGDDRSNGPLVSVIVAAKDEERFIEGCARSILGSAYENIEVVLVNDRSTDRTAALMQELAAGDPRIKAVSIGDLPEGWTGKTHAMYHGVNASTGELLVFTDADAVMHADTIPRAVGFLRAKGLDMLSLLPGFTRRGFAEDVAYLHMAMGIQLFFPLTDVNDPTKPASLASGCFIMVRRSAYEGIGTWERLRSDLTEDVALSRVLKASGRRIMALRGGSYVQTRPFSAVSEACRFWKRTYYGALERDPRRVLRLVANYAALCMNWLLLVLSALVLVFGSATTPVGILFGLGVLAAAAIVVPTAVLLVQDRGNTWNSLLCAIGIIMTGCVALSTLITVLTDRGIRWRGSVYR